MTDKKRKKKKGIKNTEKNRNGIGNKRTKKHKPENQGTEKKRRTATCLNGNMRGRRRAHRRDSKSEGLSERERAC
jgi:hypothetical protein